MLSRFATRRLFNQHSRLAPTFFSNSYSAPPKVDLSAIPDKLLINNQWVKSASGKTFPSINPSSEEVLKQVAEGDKADVDKAVAAATEAFYDGPWSKMNGYERGVIINRLANLIEANIDEIAAIEVMDNGKPWKEARYSDLPAVIHTYRYFAGLADKINGKFIEPGLAKSLIAFEKYEPVGVVGQIIPWNFPALMQAWKLAPALAAGCTIVLKPAEQTPLSALRIGQLAIEAGLPPGVLNIIPGFGETAGAAISRHPDIDKVAFTGSTEVGVQILKDASATNLKRVTLELGGKSPNIILADADIPKAVEQAHNGIFFNQGEVCCAGSRLFVQDKAYDEVLSRSVDIAKNRKLGNPLDPEVSHGAQVDKSQFEKIMNYIEIGKKEGAKLSSGGKRFGNKGYFVEPTIFTEVSDNMTIAQEEIFGPVLSVMKFRDLDEVIKRANATKYGLSAAVFTQDISKAHYIANKLRAGTVWINCFNVIDASVPFGGFKMSGIGRELGVDSIKNYLESKSIYTKL